MSELEQVDDGAAVKEAFSMLGDMLDGAKSQFIPEDGEDQGEDDE